MKYRDEFRGWRVVWFLLGALWTLPWCLLLASMASTASGQAIGTTPAAQPSRFIRTSEVRVLDGDTIEARMHFAYGVEMAPQAIRGLGWDCWESRNIVRNGVRVSPEEIAKGKLAALVLKELIGANTLFIDPDGEGRRDVYGRPLARFYVRPDKGELIDVARFMRDNGHQRVSAKP